MIWFGFLVRPFSRWNLASIASLHSGMPPTSVYLVFPASMAWIAASLMLAGVSKSGSPAPSPMTLRPAAFRARALSVTAMVADGFTRSRAADRNGIIISLTRARTHHVSPLIHESFCWDRRTLKRVTLRRKNLAPKCPDFRERKKGCGCARATFIKIQRRNDSFLARTAIGEWLILRWPGCAARVLLPPTLSRPRWH